MTFLRWVLAVLSLALCTWVLVSGYQALTSTPDQIKLVDLDESVVQIVEFVRQDIERFFQMGVVVLGGLWAISIIDKDQRVKSTDGPEIVMFLVATALFLICFYFLQQYDSIVRQAVWDTRTLLGNHGQKQFPDLLNSPYLNLQSTVVVRCFYSGMAVSGAMSFSLCRLRSCL
jgi:hypothetical protein